MGSDGHLRDGTENKAQITGEHGRVNDQLDGWICIVRPRRLYVDGKKLNVSKFFHA